MCCCKVELGQQRSAGWAACLSSRSFGHRRKSSCVIFDRHAWRHHEDSLEAEPQRRIQVRGRSKLKLSRGEEGGLVCWCGAAETKVWQQLVDDQDYGDLVVKPARNLEIFQVSAAPWRKMYNRNFLTKNRLHFPEGDYFYEAEAFHWLTTLTAQRIGLVDEILAFHRDASTEASSRTSPPDEQLRHAGYFATVNKVAKRLFMTGGKMEATLLDAFFAWVLRSQVFLDTKMLESSRTRKMQQKFNAVWYKTCHRWFSRTPSWYQKSQTSVTSVLSSLEKFVRETQVTIVIPCHNAKHDVVSLLGYLEAKHVFLATKKQGSK